MSSYFGGSNTSTEYIILNYNISTVLLSIMLPGVHEENTLAFIHIRERWNEDKFPPPPAPPKTICLGGQESSYKIIISSREKLRLQHSLWHVMITL